jgi:hypothetical protein
MRTSATTTHRTAALSCGPCVVLLFTPSRRVDTNCTTPSRIPTVNGNTVRSYSTCTHGQQPAAKGSLTTVSRSDIRLIQYLDSLAWSGGGS